MASALSLKQLRYFDAVARLRHFGRAAQACAVTQPALSMQIQEFERSLGVALIERRPKQVALTAVGAEIAGRVREVLRGIDEIEAHARSRRDGLDGELALGVIPTVAPYLLPGALKRLATTAPSLRLRVRESQTAALIEALRDCRLDAAVLALPIGEPWLAARHLFDDPFVLALPPGASAGGDRDVGADAARRLAEVDRLLLLEEGHCFRDQALAVCGEAGRGATEMFGASSLSTLAGLTAAGLGATLLPALAAEAERRAHGLSLARFDAEGPSRRIGLAWRRAAPPSAALDTLAEALCAAKAATPGMQAAAPGTQAAAPGTQAAAPGTQAAAPGTQAAMDAPGGGAPKA